MADLPPAVESELRLGSELAVAHVHVRRHSVVVVVRDVPEDHQESDEHLWEVLHVIDSRWSKSRDVGELVAQMVELGAVGVIEVILMKPTFISPGARFRSQRLWRYETESTGDFSSWTQTGMTHHTWMDPVGMERSVDVGEVSERQEWRRDRG